MDALAVPKFSEDSIGNYAAQILAVTFYPSGQVDEAIEASGFALSFNSLGKPQIFHLLGAPVSISKEYDSFESWLDSSGSDQFHVQNAGTNGPTGIVDLEE
ncbi:hypothetical protein PRK78_002530 [Emydomyces testavorans]|uniref:Uncharacterized protein n=1 Tax=Emydomyces testavorans TaxID=2070801 RepID=A0AAF0IGJ9_9EURO|nr:hypothetical protein PRK78_002530 [Emydomyces testavorans]